MTYCLALNVDRGLIFCSDSRTNAGMDNIGSYSKMHTSIWPGERIFVLLSAGNLATTQAVVKKIHLDIEQALVPNLLSVASMIEAADYVGMASTTVQRNQASRDTANTNFEATFIFGGQLGNAPPETFMIYPQGNYIHESSEHPFLQIGETKYGKPILDRVIKRHVNLERAARCALVSMNSTIRSNVTVGPPVELLIYERDSLTEGRRLYLTDDDPFARELAERWNEGLILALENLPHFPWEDPAKTGVDAKLSQLKQQMEASQDTAPALEDDT
jgi:putative proteasome-type protease